MKKEMPALNNEAGVFLWKNPANFLEEPPEMVEKSPRIADESFL